MQKNYTQLLLGVLIGLLVGLLVGKFVFVAKQNTASIPTVNSNVPVQSNSSQTNSPKYNRNKQSNSNNSSNDASIPAKVYEVLKYIKENGQAMDGYVGGRVFQNRENQLDMATPNGDKINYQEWDVNPKVQGKNRGTERIVTGDDGRSWYTNDHYKTFKEIK